MIPIYYKSSEGVVVNLIETPYRMLTETDLLNWEWQYETVGNNFPYATAFKNQMVSKTFKLRVSGSSETDFLNNLEHLVETVDRDTRLLQKGKLYFGNYYLECLIIGCEKAKVYKKTYTTLQLKVLAEDGDWKSTQDQSYSGVSGGKYINKYCVPSVSSNENDYEYGVVEDTQGTFTFTAQFSQGYNVSYYMTFTFESVSANISYKLDNGSDVTVTPSDCPLEIDVSSANNIVITPSQFLTISYSMTAEPNANYINWSSAVDDETREFVLDLGDITSVESVSGMFITNLTNSQQTAKMELSQDGVNWATAKTETLNANQTKELGLTTLTDFRYLKVTSSGQFQVNSRTFKIEAHFTGENQNLATSCVVSSAPNQTYIVTEEGIVELYKRYTNVGIITKMDFTLAETTTVVEINNLTLTNNDSASRTFVVYGDNNVLDTVTVNANSSTNYSWSGEEELSTISLGVKAQNFEISSSNFEILEEQTEAPHRYILNENYVPSDAIIRIYGPTTFPSIMIGDNQYGAENITLDDGEYLEINTKDETIQHYVDSEGWVNVFNHRLDDTFEKIEVGTSEITWQGNLDTDIRLLNSRSDPKWN